MSAPYRYSNIAVSAPAPKTEFDVLKASHKFLREDEDDKDLSWDDQVAKKYYTSLFREYAVCDLKHYKSGNFAMRWRTEAEVLSGLGESTCGNTRCSHHTREDGTPLKTLKTLELPFAYTEQGAHKSALVKVVLCDKCCKKLMWKREKEKATEREKERKEVVSLSEDGVGDAHGRNSSVAPVKREFDNRVESGSHKKRRRERGIRDEGRGRNSRSRSPRDRSKAHRTHEGRRQSLHH